MEPIEENIYYQYFLNSENNTVIKLQYKKESGLDLDVFKLNHKRESFCANVKTDWDKQKMEEIKASKEQEQILEAQKKVKKEQSSMIKCQGNNYKQWTKCNCCIIS